MTYFADQYRTLMQGVADDLNAFYGELVTVAPMITKPNFGATINPDKPMFEVTAIFTHVAGVSLGARDKKMNSYGLGDEYGIGVVTREPLFSFKTDDLIGRPILRGYQIERCVDQTLWDVIAVKPDGISRTEVKVVQMGKQKSW